MKNITRVLVLFTLLFSSAIFSQTIEEEVEVIQEIFGAEKKEIYLQNMNLDGVDAAAFWKLFDSYEAERKVLGKERLKLLQSYTMQQGAVSNAQADALLKKVIPLSSAHSNLISKYTKKIKKATSPLVAAQFYQIENYINDGIRFTILDNIDFIQDK